MNMSPTKMSPLEIKVFDNMHEQIKTYKKLLKLKEEQEELQLELLSS